MDAGNIIRALRPNVTALGYALFLAINAAGVWGGVFPFLPLDFQTPEIVFWFFLAQSLAFSLSYFASAVGVYYYPGPTRSFLVKLAAIPYMLGWCFLVAAIYVDAFALPFVFVGGGLLGLGSAGFYMLWQRLFSSQDSDRGNHDLMLGTAYGAVLYFSLYLIPVAVTAYLIPLVFLPLFGLVIVLKGREIDRDQPMFEDVPHEHPQVYRRAVHDLWRSALCVGALGFCTGIMRSLAIGEPAVGSLVNVLSMAATLVAAVTLLTLWQFKNLRLNVVSMYRVVFPFVITAFLLLPFLVVTYSQWLAAVLYALYSVAIMLMMMQCAQASRDRGINPVFVYGIVGGVVYTLHDIGFLSGTFAEQIDVMGVPPLAAVALVAVYLLGLMYFVGQGGFRKILGGGSASDSIELVALRPHGMRGGSLATDGQSARKKVPAPRRKSNRTPKAPSAKQLAKAEKKAARSVAETAALAGTGMADGAAERGAGGTTAANAGDGPQYRDRISKQAEVLRQHYRLSARETEVMELIARGNSVARIAEELVVSENTIRTHAKRIYAKLDIHKKQELLDLIEPFDPHELKG